MKIINYKAKFTNLYKIRIWLNAKIYWIEIPQIVKSYQSTMYHVIWRTKWTILNTITKVHYQVQIEWKSVINYLLCTIQVKICLLKLANLVTKLWMLPCYHNKNQILQTKLSQNSKVFKRGKIKTRFSKIS